MVTVVKVLQKNRHIGFHRSKCEGRGETLLKHSRHTRLNSGKQTIDEGEMPGKRWPARHVLPARAMFQSNVHIADGKERISQNQRCSRDSVTAKTGRKRRHKRQEELQRRWHQSQQSEVWGTFSTKQTTTEMQLMLSWRATCRHWMDVDWEAEPLEGVEAAGQKLGQEVPFLFLY